MGFFTKKREDVANDVVHVDYEYYKATWDGKQFILTPNTTPYKPQSARIVADNTCVVSFYSDGSTTLRPLNGLEKVKNAIELSRGGPAPVQVQGYA